MTRREAKKIAHNLAMRAIDSCYGAGGWRLENVSDEDWGRIQIGLEELSEEHAGHAAELPPITADA